MRLALRPLALLALVLALALGGCGGGEEETTSATAAAPQQGQEDSAPEQRAEGEGEAVAPTSPEPNPPISADRTPGSTAVAPEVPTIEGGDNSVQTFGAEGEEDQAAQATQTLLAYLAARIGKDWAAACAETSAQLREELAKLIERARVKDDAQKPQGCAETLELLYGKTPEQALKEAAEVNRVLSFRVRDDGYAYLIYEDGEGAIRFIAMSDDEGQWRPNVIEPTKLPEGDANGQPQ
jgi:hypothetical protein